MLLTNGPDTYLVQWRQCYNDKAVLLQKHSCPLIKIRAPNKTRITDDLTSRRLVLVTGEKVHRVFLLHFIRCVALSMVAFSFWKYSCPMYGQRPFGFWRLRIQEYRAPPICSPTWTPICSPTMDKHSVTLRAKLKCKFSYNNIIWLIRLQTKLSNSRKNMPWTEMLRENLIHI